MKDIVETAELFDCSDASFARNVEVQLIKIKDRSLCRRDRFVTIHSCMGSNRTPCLKLQHNRVGHMQNHTYQRYSSNSDSFTQNLYKAERTLFSRLMRPPERIHAQRYCHLSRPNRFGYRQQKAHRRNFFKYRTIRSSALTTGNPSQDCQFHQWWWEFPRSRRLKESRN